MITWDNPGAELRSAERRRDDAARRLRKERRDRAIVVVLLALNVLSVAYSIVRILIGAGYDALHVTSLSFGVATLLLAPRVLRSCGSCVAAARSVLLEREEALAEWADEVGEDDAR